MKEPRDHHFLPQFYLKGFADGDGFVHVLELNDGRRWQAKPAGVAFRKDFHKVEWDGNPFQLEKDIANKIEDALSRVLRKVLDEKRLPDGPAVGHISDLVALLAARVPHEVESPQRFAHEKFKEHMRDATRTEQRYEELQAAGKIPLDISYADAVKCMESEEAGRVRMELNNNAKMGHMLRTMDRIRELLDARHWALVFAPAGTNFICSDRPVQLNWYGDDPPWTEPDYDMPGSWVYLPLSKSVGLVGHLEAGAGSGTTTAMVMAHLNSLVLGSATSQIYFAGGDFIWSRVDGEVGNTADLIRQLQNGTRG